MNNLFVIRKCPRLCVQHSQRKNTLFVIKINRATPIRVYSISNKPTRTALYDFHLQHGGKIVSFEGTQLPVQYINHSISASHLHTRKHGSIFDVSHMLQTWVRGKGAIQCLESICTADIAGAAMGTAVLTLFTCPKTGGILDDLIVTKVDEKTVYVVSNAGMKRQDMQIMSDAVKTYKSRKADVSIEFLQPEEQSLIAVQGPLAVATLKQLLPKNSINKLDQLYFMQSASETVAGVPDCRITRCGYTGEDGVEISMQSAHVQHITEALLNLQLDKTKGTRLLLAGLGARDSLRLEAGLCLYGNDIDVQTTPIEANLSWLIGKRRRMERNFPGAEKILHQLSSNASVPRRRIGVQMQGVHVPSARSDFVIYQEGQIVGKITSGGPSPVLNKNIAMGYINEPLKKVGTLVELKIRNKFYTAQVVSMPFVKTNYYIKPKK